MMHIFIPTNYRFVDIDKEFDPDLLGEALRHWSFIGRNSEVGCYSTFELPDFFKKVESGEEYSQALKQFWPDDEGQKLQCFIYNQPEFKDEYIQYPARKIVLAYKWDGDGTLYFRVVTKGRDFSIINYDCKKSYGWEFVTI